MDKNTNLYRFDIPFAIVSSNRISFRPYYLYSETCPTKEQVICFLKTKNAKNYEYEEDSETEGQILDIVSICSDWPSLRGEQVSTNTLVQIPKFGLTPVFVKKITPIQL